MSGAFTPGSDTQLGWWSSSDISAFDGEEPIETSALGRIAYQAARQLFVQKLREVESESVFSEFANKKGDIVTCIVSRFEGPHLVCKIGEKAEATMLKGDQVPGENYALLVGVSQYDPTEPLPALTYPEDDIEELARTLVAAGFQRENIKLMTQREGLKHPRFSPEAAKIRKEFDLTLKRLESGDTYPLFSLSSFPRLPFAARLTANNAVNLR